MLSRKYLAAGIAGLILALSSGAAAEKKAGPEKVPAPSPAPALVDYAELSEVLQKAVVEKAPKRFEEKSEWGQMIPAPIAVRFPRLRRTVVLVNGQPQVPDGVWKRSLIWLDDPAKDIQVRVLDVQQIEKDVYHVKLSTSVFAHGERERQRWRNGVQLFGLAVQADARLAAELECDVKVTVDLKKFPPDVVVEPKVTASKLSLEKFDLNRVGNLLVGDPARELGNELKDFLEGLLRSREGEVKDYANQAITRALKDGKARIPVTDLLKLKSKAKPKAAEVKP